MRRRRSILLKVLPRVLAIAIAVVLGLLHVGPPSAPPISSTPLAMAIEQKTPVDALKVGQRLEPRVLAAPVLDRLSPIPASRPVAIAIADNRSVRFDAASAGRSGVRLFPIVKHVPRQERGDPPRT